MPTFETFLFDFEREAYGETIEVSPLHMLREERRFPSLEALRAQIALDCEQARAHFAG